MFFFLLEFRFRQDLLALEVTSGDLKAMVLSPTLVRLLKEKRTHILLSATVYGSDINISRFLWQYIMMVFTLGEQLGE